MTGIFSPTKCWPLKKKWKVKANSAGTDGEANYFGGQLGEYQRSGQPTNGGGDFQNLLGTRFFTNALLNLHHKSLAGVVREYK